MATIAEHWLEINTILVAQTNRQFEWKHFLIARQSHKQQIQHQIDKLFRQSIPTAMPDYLNDVSKSERQIFTLNLLNTQIENSNIHLTISIWITSIAHAIVTRLHKLTIRVVSWYTAPKSLKILSKGRKFHIFKLLSIVFVAVHKLNCFASVCICMNSKSCFEICTRVFLVFVFTLIAFKPCSISALNEFSHNKMPIPTQAIQEIGMNMNAKIINCILETITYRIGVFHSKKNRW